MLFAILLRVAGEYLNALKKVGSITNCIEKHLQKAQKNEELFQMLSLEKSFIYFSTALKSNEATIEKLARGTTIKLHDDDQEIIEDVLIEVRQAIETCDIYSEILSGVASTFASIISNNLNLVMKTLTSITILMAIPNTIFSFYGMNVKDLPFPRIETAVCSATILLVVFSAILIYKKMI
jgi:magnesium transporter